MEILRIQLTTCYLSERNMNKRQFFQSLVRKWPGKGMCMGMDMDMKGVWERGHERWGEGGEGEKGEGEHGHFKDRALLHFGDKVGNRDILFP